MAVLTLLFLRGAQTPGELRTRSGRLHEFQDMAEVERTLEGLTTRDEGPWWCVWRASRASVKAAICTCLAARWWTNLPATRVA